MEKGLDLIHEGITLKEKLGVRVYLAAGHCDLGSKYHCAFQLHYFLSTLFVFSNLSLCSSRGRKTITSVLRPMHFQ